MPEVGGQAPVGRREPVAQDLTITTNQDTPVILKVLASDRDADGDLLSVVSVVQPRHGTVSINPDNTVTYTPEVRFSGTDTFAYTIGDGRDGTDTGTVTVTVLPVQQRLATPSRSTTIVLTSETGAPSPSIGRDIASPSLRCATPKAQTQPTSWQRSRLGTSPVSWP